MLKPSPYCSCASCAVGRLAQEIVESSDHCEIKRIRIASLREEYEELKEADYFLKDIFLLLDPAALRKAAEQSQKLGDELGAKQIAGLAEAVSVAQEIGKLMKHRKVAERMAWEEANK